MIVLDTDHFGMFELGSSDESDRLRVRLRQSDDSKGTTIISVEEMMRGWLAKIHRENDPYRQIGSYARLQKLFLVLSKWQVLPWNSMAADQFVNLKQNKIRVGTMDLKIAAIAIANDALLLSRNIRDFEKVPNLRVENWLD